MRTVSEESKMVYIQRSAKQIGYLEIDMWSVIFGNIRPGFNLKEEMEVV